MSKISDALEVEVAALCRLRGFGGARDRAAIDRHFATLLKLLAPRIRYFLRTYGLGNAREDAEQACAIGTLRAVEMYDPTKARFTTLVNWQLRAELQALRFRLQKDARDPARKGAARTISLDSASEAAPAWLVADAEAVDRVEALASVVLARRACGTLLDGYYARQRVQALRQVERPRPSGPECVRPGTLDPDDLEQIEARLLREREIVSAHLLGDDTGPIGGGLTSEQCRQIARRTIRALSDHLREYPKPERGALEVPIGASRH